MGEKNLYQPLTKEDRTTVMLYRSGIALSTLLMAMGAVLSIGYSSAQAVAGVFPGMAADVLVLSLYFSVGLSVFFIHLYIGKFHRTLKKVYYLSVVCLAFLFILGKGSPASVILGVTSSGAMLLIPLSLCLGFVTAKEAFCFRLMEGYLLAIIMPAALFLYGSGLLPPGRSALFFGFIAGLLLLFTSRKIFMPLHYDIGDKSAYQP